MSTDLNALYVFAKVVQTSSFTAAARALGMPRSTVSQRVLELEERLGARLLQRTTRRLNLTDAGRIYYDHCVRIVAEINDAERSVTNMQAEPRGLLRVTVPASSLWLGPIFVDFLRRHTGIQLEVAFTDRVVDLVEESFDVAIRAGALLDSSLVAQKLGTIRFLMVASPGYLKKRGRPRSPDGLTKHDCLVFNVGSLPRIWNLTQGTEKRAVAVTGALSVNEVDTLHDAAIAGVGIAMLPAYHCIGDLRAKRLERVLPDWDAAGEPAHAVYPSGRHLSPKVKAFLDVLRQLKSAPWSINDGHGRSSQTRPRGERA
jgi:DNA-binding transcriptional LysR family regulator